MLHVSSEQGLWDLLKNSECLFESVFINSFINSFAIQIKLTS